MGQNTVKDILQDGCPECFGVAPSVSDGRFGMPLAERELYNRTGSAQGCPK